MPCLLNSRKLIETPCCYYCKYCLYVSDAFCTEEAYFCMLDVSSKDRDFAKKELLERDIKVDKYSSNLIRILDMDTERPSLWDTPRSMEPQSCCQFYE